MITKESYQGEKDISFQNQEPVKKSQDYSIFKNKATGK